MALFNRKQTDVTTRLRGNAAEDAALAHLLAAGLQLVERNYRTPGRGGGEIDLVMREAGGTLVFVEVRARAGTTHGGAAASVGAVKQRRIVLAARHYLLRHRAAAVPLRRAGHRRRSHRMAAGRLRRRLIPEPAIRPARPGPAPRRAPKVPLREPICS